MDIGEQNEGPFADLELFLAGGGTASSHRLLLESLVIHVGRQSEDGRALCICLELLKKPPFAPTSWRGIHHAYLVCFLLT